MIKKDVIVEIIGFKTDRSNEVLAVVLDDATGFVKIIGASKLKLVV